MINYLLYRALLHVPTVHVWWGLFLTFEFISGGLLMFISNSPILAHSFMFIELLIALFNTFSNVFVCIGVFSPTYEIPRSSTLFWSIAFFAVFFVALNLAISIACGLTFFVFNISDWTELVAEFTRESIEEAEPIDTSVKPDSGAAGWELSRVNVERSKKIVYFVVECLLAIEATIYTIYIITIVSLGSGNFNFTGWVYVLQITTIVVALAWHENFKAYMRLSPSQKQIGVALTVGGTSKESPSLDTLMVSSFVIFIIDGAQLIYVQKNDFQLLVVMRAFLCVIAGLYFVTILLATFKYAPPPKYIQMYFGIQFIVSMLMIIELFWVVSYFCYYDSVHVTLGSNQYIFWNIAHTATVLAAIALIFVTNRPLDAMAGLWIMAGVVLAGDIIVIGTMPLQNRTSSEYFVQAIFMVIDVLYILMCGFMWTGATADDGITYMKAVDRERQTFEHYRKMFDYRIDKITTPEQMAKFNELSADRIYYIITSCIKTVALVDMVLVIFYTIILSVNVHTTTLWYQWFYLAHYLSAFAGLALATFELPIQIIFIFLIVMAIVCMIIDIINMAFLAPIVTEGEISIQSFFLAVDVCQIVFVILCMYRVSPAAYALILTMPKLLDRLYMLKIT